MSRDTCNALFVWKGDIMWNMDYIHNLPTALKVIVLILGFLIISSGLWLSPDKNNKDPDNVDDQPLDRMSKS